MMTGQHEVTELLVAWENGDRQALERLVPLVEKELRTIARRYMRRERPGHLLQTTALVNEAFIKLMKHNRIHWRNRAHFFAVAALCMRRILIDYAIAEGQQAPVGIPVSAANLLAPEKSAELIALDEALQRLAKVSPRQAWVFELRFFGGMTDGETAEVTGVSTSTVNRDWAAAKRWIRSQLGGKKSSNRKAV